MPIRNWDPSLQPREKALHQGFSGLSDAELIALLIGSGTAEKSAVALANDLLNQLGGLSGLYRLSLEELKQHRGIGCSRACRILAVLEINRRIHYADMLNKNTIAQPEDLIEWLKAAYGHMDSEYFIAVYLDGKGRVISYRELFKGTGNAVQVDSRLIFANALALKASSLIVAHNHPSQSVCPSALDESTTRSLEQAGRLIGVPLIDSLIVSRGNYYSFKENKIL